MPWCCVKKHSVGNAAVLLPGVLWAAWLERAACSRTMAGREENIPEAKLINQPRMKELCPVPDCQAETRRSSEPGGSSCSDENPAQLAESQGYKRDTGASPRALSPLLGLTAHGVVFQHRYSSTITQCNIIWHSILNSKDVLPPTSQKKKKNLFCTALHMEGEIYREDFQGEKSGRAPPGAASVSLPPLPGLRERLCSSWQLEKVCCARFCSHPALTYEGINNILHERALRGEGPARFLLLSVEPVLARPQSNCPQQLS